MIGGLSPTESLGLRPRSGHVMPIAALFDDAIDGKRRVWSGHGVHLVAQHSDHAGPALCARGSKWTRTALTVTIGASRHQKLNSL